MEIQQRNVQGKVENYKSTEHRIAQENPGFTRDDVQAVAGLRNSLLQQGNVGSSLSVGTKIFEVTAFGYDGSLDETDDRVFWVKAQNLQEVRAALAGTKANVHGMIEDEVEIDFVLPGQAELFAEKLKEFEGRFLAHQGNVESATMTPSLQGTETELKASLLALTQYIERDLENNSPEWKPEDIPEYANAKALLEQLNGNVEAATLETPLDLSKLDEHVLIAELQRRGMSVQAWSADDFEFIVNEDEDVIELDLTDEALEKVQQQAFEQARRDLDNIVTARGTEHLADWWAMNKAPLLEQFQQKTADDGPSPGM